MADPGMAEIQKEALKVVGGEPASRSKVAADKLQKTYQEDGARAALEDARINRESGLSPVKRQEAIETNIFFDPANPDINQQAKRNQAQGAIEKAGKYASEKFDNLSNAEKVSLRADISDKIQGTNYLRGFYQGLNPAQRTALTEGVLKDPHFQRAVNHRLQELAEKRITEADKDARATDRGISHVEAAGQLETEWVYDLENAVGEEAGKFFRQQLDLADQAWQSEKTGIQNEDCKKIIDILDKEWTDKVNGKINTQRDLDAFLKDGIEGIVKVRSGINTAEKDRILKDPDLRDQVEGKVLHRVVELQLRQGNKLKQEDWYKLADKYGQDKITDIFTDYKVIKDAIQKAKDDGLVEPTFLEGLKKLPRNKWLAVLLALMAVSVVGAPAIPSTLKKYT